jgi:hypothetical protein
LIERIYDAGWKGDARVHRAGSTLAPPLPLP